MNERLRELVRQAGIDDNPDQEGLDLFAELIVRECAQVADIKRDTLAGCGYVTYTDGQRIKQHFGVE